MTVMLTSPHEEFITLERESSRKIPIMRIMRSSDGRREGFEKEISKDELR